ncbi:MAG TPA: DUF1398 domain-containing protein [Rhodospirillaceae bacterium]|nr:DUF1398 domain-containing protein [Rhodospirillaceae bacterium]
MDFEIANECVALSLAGKITFPEVVQRLAAAGAERYIVDLVGLKKITFGVNGSSHYNDFPLQNPPPVSKDFNASKIQQTIRDIQQQKINYVTFLERVMAAGCCHYEVYIDGRKAIYFGCSGDQHIENFPQAR